ncbi:hypothetical protein KW787_00875 [Candidatus Pacearchaeota archaeon]|nr:hypothetical protein [Candidatus Pacearchaeota archaeon]
MKKEDAIILLIVCLLIAVLLIFVVVLLRARSTGFVSYDPSPTPMSEENLTLSLIQAGKAYNEENGNLRQEAFTNALELSEKRKSALILLASKDPGRFLELVLPEEAKDILPVITRSSLEQEVDIEGDLSVLHADRDDGSENSYFLHTPEEDLSVYFIDEKSYFPGLVKLHGIKLGNTIVVPPGNSNVISAFTKKGIPHNVAFILFSVGGLTRPASSEETVKSLLKDNPLIENNTKKEIYGWYTITRESCPVLSCSPDLSSSWMNGAKKIATDNGFIESQYDSVVYLALANDSCGFTALTCLNQRSVLSSYSTKNWVSQELGNSIGLSHARNDIYDVMGGGNNLSGFHMHELGMIGDREVGEITSTGIYSLSPLGGKGVQVLRIPYDDSHYYYLEYRQSGLTIYKAPDYLSSEESEFVGNFGNGENFFDPIRDVRVSLTSVSDSITLSVLFGPARCTRENPSVVLSPSSHWGNSSNMSTYTLNILNRDYKCPDSTFNIGVFLPSDWRHISQTSVNMASGANASIPVTVISPKDSGTGFYPFNVDVINSNVPEFHSNTRGSYAVSGI